VHLSPIPSLIHHAKEVHFEMDSAKHA